MILYEYDNKTGEYIREIKAVPCPLRKGVYIPQENTIDIPPLEPKEGCAVLFDVEVKAWEYVLDNRGRAVYNTATGNLAGTIKSVTEYLGEGYTFEVPNAGDIWKDGSWQPSPPPTLEKLESMKKAQMQKAIELEAYPLMFQSFIGNVDKQTVLDKIAEIEKRFEV